MKNKWVVVKNHKCKYALSLLFAFLAGVLLLEAGNDNKDLDYYDSNFIRYDDFVYKNNIKTILLNQRVFDFSPPMIRLNSNDKLVLRFDDLEGGHQNYYYTIIHCDAKWRPSDMHPHQYIEGFYDDRISDFNSSFNTQVEFTHYKLEFPNENMQPKKTGNYIFKVFKDNDRNNIVLTKRFMVYEQNVTISADVFQAREVSLRNFKQEISFSINTNEHVINNPYNEITVVIKQNSRWDNLIYDLEPKSVSNNVISYDYNSEILFYGGNEFRYFDTKSLKQTTSRIDDIIREPRKRKVILRKDQRRAGQRYVFEHDINGKFFIQNERGHDQHLESDYAKVLFTLDMPSPLVDGNIYLGGEFTNWKYDDNSRMHYNYNKKAYQKTLLLKQGYYNYIYMFLEDGEEHTDITRIEGTHSETENQYTILVYHRPIGSYSDNLVGIKHLNTHDDNN